LSPNARLFEQACPLFVPLAEEGLTEHEATRLICREYLAPMTAADIDALVLGCTHYPLLSKVIAETVGPKVELCDSASALTAAARAMLTETSALAAQPRPAPRLLLTDVNPHFCLLAERFFGAGVAEPERIDL
jgi:glutamate racemase